MIGHCEALGTLSALGPWLEGLLLLLTPRTTWRLLLLLLGMEMNRGEMPRMRCD